jgi:hypothetical protein
MSFYKLKKGSKTLNLKLLPQKLLIWLIMVEWGWTARNLIARQKVE